MDKKRKAPARASRAESGKKRILTPPEPGQTPTPAESPAPLVVYQELLPKKIEAGKALPTVEEPQNLDNLQSKDYQSVADSGVLADSLTRSRQKWLSEGIFEKYWTKPVKKKGVPDVPVNNPTKDTMTKLGHVTISVEPHLFEAQMFAIKDITPRPQLPQSQPQNLMYRPIIQYGPPSGSFPLQPPVPTPPPMMQRPITTPQATPQLAKTECVQMINFGLTPPSSTNGSHANGMLPVPNPPRTTIHNPHPQAAPPPPAGRGTDPVIQMLAERAATDLELKALMRIVANGEASHSQLKSFQNHIDDLTGLQKARQAAAQAALTPQSSKVPSAQSQSQINNKIAPVSAQSPAPPTAIPMISPAPSVQPVKQEFQQTQPQALRSKGPVPPSKSDISGVVFEFTGGNGDRYLFPKFSILEHIPGNQIVASFLIVRKGSSSDSTSYDPDLDYYQPITIRIQSSSARQLESLQKVVAPQEEVQRYMNDVMDHATRAEYVLLAMRLPKDIQPTPNAEKDDDDKTEQAPPIVGWATTNPTPPVSIKVKPAKKVPTEEEQYHNFIDMVREVPL